MRARTFVQKREKKKDCGLACTECVDGFGGSSRAMSTEFYDLLDRSRMCFATALHVLLQLSPALSRLDYAIGEFSSQVECSYVNTSMQASVAGRAVDGYKNGTVTLFKAARVAVSVTVACGNHSSW